MRYKVTNYLCKNLFQLVPFVNQLLVLWADLLHLVIFASYPSLPKLQTLNRITQKPKKETNLTLAQTKTPRESEFETAGNRDRSAATTTTRHLRNQDWKSKAKEEEEEEDSGKESREIVRKKRV